MSFFSDLLSAPGLIVGPLMLLAGVAAGALCAWATFRPGQRAARRAVWWSLMPAALGLMGAVYGGVRWFIFYGTAVAPCAQTWPVLGFTALFGVLVSVVPLAWAVALARRAPEAPAGQAAADFEDRATADLGAPDRRPPR